MMLVNIILYIKQLIKIINKNKRELIISAKKLMKDILNL